MPRSPEPAFTPCRPSALPPRPLARWAPLLASLSLVACTAAQGATGPAAPADRPLRVVTTTTMIADFARQVAGDRAEVSSLLKVGADPHTYEPVPGDSRRIAEADLVLQNGWDLEAWLERLTANAGGAAPRVEAAAHLPALPWRPAQGADAGGKRWDPHLWMDPTLAIGYVERIAQALGEIDPEGEPVYRAGAARYAAELRALDRWTVERLSGIPAERRKLVTTHDAYQYWARRYGFEVIGTVWGVTTEEEPSPAAVARLVEELRRHGVPAFIETTINPELMQELAREAGVAIGGKLYGDSLGPEGSGAGTYVGMMRQNADAIARALEAPAEAPAKEGRR